ncbi:MAG: DEAD/DEAH box helicase family protein [Treponema sp.]|nr:DEAD/DEAH box helicase family protein [Treponema sp.]
MDALKRFTPAVIAAMQQDVAEAGGNEVFWAGRINEDGIVTSVHVGSRGNINSVIVNSSTARAGHVLIHNHPSGRLAPSGADQAVAENATDSSLGFYIVNNDISEVYVVLEPVKPKKTQKLDPDKAAWYISQDGPLARKSDAYEERPTQIELLKEVSKTFNENKIGVFEAGTGVGKSYAYLIPSLLWAESNKERVVISTGTINLQQQLVEKDLPAAEKIIGKKVKYILLKGRQNYVCMRRLAEAGEERDLFSEDQGAFDSIVAWAKNSATGSRSDISWIPPESVWSRVNSESDACMGGKCPFREDCFVMKNRKEAADALVIVVNHHLLFADIESRMNGGGYDDTAVLPPYRRIVFDEAHGIEDSATSFFSESITSFKLKKQLRLLYRTRKSSKAGLLMTVSLLTNDDSFIANASATIKSITDRMDQLDEVAFSLLNNSYSLRLSEATAPSLASLFPVTVALKESIGDLTGLLHETLDNLSDDDKDIPAVWETKSVVRRLEGFIKLLKDFSEWNEHPDKVFYFQKERLPPRKAGEKPLWFASFTATPLDVSHMMAEGVFTPMDSVVCTSATLRTGGSFSYWMRRTGAGLIEEDRLSQALFDSPFPYGNRVLFAVPGDAPLPTQESQSFQSFTHGAVPELIEASGGRTLVLFTSYESLRQTYASCRSRLEKAGISCLKQGDDDRFRLLESFKTDRTSCLFATSSFWEGVDVPGESLSQVIIVKLPFPVPTDPVFAARSEAIEKNGGSSFMELSVPDAVIKFRQGFGRLIRRSDDKGVIVVLDRRITTKPYGRIFISSIPETRRMANPLAYIVSAEKRFWENT